MRPLTLPLIAAAEGFGSLGIEVIALRRLVPHLGSSIVVTAPTIGLFLLALAFGYASGARIAQPALARIGRNFLVAALLAGVGLSRVGVDALFGAASDPWLAYGLLMAVVVCPAAYLLAQAVPLVAGALGGAGPVGEGRGGEGPAAGEGRRDGEGRTVGEASGAALTASTAGSVAAAAGLSLLVMPWLGVSAAVAACVVSLCAGAWLAWRAARRELAEAQAGGPVSASASISASASAPPQAAPVRGARTLAGGGPGPLAPVALGLVLVAANLWPAAGLTETAYADYRVVPVELHRLPAGGTAPASQFVVNGQRASSLDASQPPRRSPYIERIAALLREEPGLARGEVLVLGAGGFTLSLGDERHRYTYVDIDPAIRAIAEREFLHGAVQGEFVADDARRFVARAGRRYDAVVVDVFSAHASVPAHLVTLEFWSALPGVLAEGGLVVVNLILEPSLQSAYARNLLATIERALGRCAVEVLNRRQHESNVIVACRPSAGAPPVELYVDERNPADLQRGTRGY